MTRRILVPGSGLRLRLPWGSRLLFSYWQASRTAEVKIVSTKERNRAAAEPRSSSRLGAVWCATLRRHRDRIPPGGRGQTKSGAVERVSSPQGSCLCCRVTVHR